MYDVSLINIFILANSVDPVEMPPYNAKEPLYSNSGVILGWLQSTRAQNIPFKCTCIKKGNNCVNILLLKIFFADYWHLYIPLYNA